MEGSLSKVAGQVLSLLPSDGKPVSNTVICRELEISSDRFQAARFELIEKGLASSGKGRGGSLRRVAEGWASLRQGLPIQPLVELFSKEGKADFKERANIENDEAVQFENQLWRLVYNLQPKLITTGRDPVFELKTGRFRPDLCAIFDQFALISDCKHTFHGTYVSDWLDKVDYSRGDIQQIFQRSGINRIIYLCVVKDVQSLEQRIHARARKLSVKLIDSQQLEYFTTVHREAGIGVSHLFWAEVAPKVVHLEEESVPALSVKLGKRREAFVFSINAHHLLPRARVSHRELHGRDVKGIGYQRMLRKGRLNSIAKHIKSFKTFPTPIVLILDDNTRFDHGKTEDATSRSRVGHLWLSDKPGSVQVIDGQHRLYGYSLVPPEDDHIIHVIAYKSGNDFDPARMFVDINSKQKPVSSGLMWELYPNIYQQQHSDYFRAMISVALEGAIEGRQNLVHHISSGSRGAISFAALCAEIPKSGLLTREGGFIRSIAGNTDDQTKRLESWMTTFFDVLTNLEHSYPKVVQTLFLRNVGVIPALRLYGKILKYEYSLGNHDVLKNSTKRNTAMAEYFRIICQQFEERELSELESLRSQRSSQGGYKRLFDEFVEIIDKKHRPGFAGAKRSEGLYHRAEEFIALVENINRQGTMLGTTSAHVFKEFDPSSIRRIAKKSMDIDSFERLIKTLHQEIFEGSGDKGPQNRLASLLGVNEIIAVDSLKELAALRVYYSHKSALLDSQKRRYAVEAFRRLHVSLGSVNPAELSNEECETAANSLLDTLSSSVLKPALKRIIEPTV
jgi:DGQHR domain-containing protein